MSLEFNYYSLGDLVKIKYGKNQKKVQDDENGKYPIYGTGGLMGYSIDYLYDKPSVLIGRKGSIEKVRYIEEPFWTVDTLFYTEVNDKIVIPKFLYYVMSLINLSRYNEGTSIPSLRTETLNRLDLPIPNLNYQKRVLTVLSSIDKKISLNKKINKNLEEQIETIYNSFFVYYDDFLKEELEECEIGFIPKDWNLMTLGQITTQIKEKVGKNNYKVFSAVNTGNLILSEEYFDKQVFSKSIEKYIVVKQDEFAYNPARINIGSIGRNDFDYEGCVSPVYVAFKVEEGYENFMNMFIKSKRFNQWVITLSSGSVRQTLNYNDFSIIKIAYPPKSLVNKFNVIYESYYEVINYNKSVIYNLEEIRDTLLPKLMSGEIDVSKINCDLELKYNYIKYLFNQIHTPIQIRCVKIT